MKKIGTIVIKLMSFPEVKAEDLALALNSVESLLSSQSSSSPALNLIIYIPPVHRNPAYIYVYTLFPVVKLRLNRAAEVLL